MRGKSPSGADVIDARSDGVVAVDKGPIQVEHDGLEVGWSRVTNAVSFDCLQLDKWRVANFAKASGSEFP